MLVKLSSGAILRNALKQRLVDIEIAAKNLVLGFLSLLDSTLRSFNRYRRMVKDTIRINKKMNVDIHDTLLKSEIKG